MAHSCTTSVRNRERDDALVLALRHRKPPFEVVRQKPFGNLSQTGRADLVDVTRRSVACRYGFITGRISQAARDELKLLLKTHETINYLDAGAGYGNGLVEAGKISPDVCAHGLSLNAPDPEFNLPANCWTRGYFEATTFREKGDASVGPFKVIDSGWALMHSVNISRALDNVLNSLAINGKLFNTPAVNYWRHFDRQPLYTKLRAQGFRIYIGEEGMEIFIRNSGAVADLSHFYGDGEINKIPLPS